MSTTRQINVHEAKTHFSRLLEEVDEQLAERLHHAADEVIERAETDGIDDRSAAYRIATERVKDAFFLSGF